MGWALDGGEDIGGDLAMMDYLAELEEELEDSRQRREDSLKGKYLIICRAPSNGHLLYLQDRSVSKRGFWTRYKSNAIGFRSKEAADRICSGFKYNSPEVIFNK